MKQVDIKDIDFEETYFHFTNRSNVDSIDENGLIAQSGGASKMVGDDENRVCMSFNWRGLLNTKNSFIYEFKQRRICDIPMEYRKYLDAEDLESTDIVSEKALYEAMERKFKEEVYLVIDAKEGEDYLEDEVKTNYDIKGIENHDISADKIALLTREGGNSAWDILNYMYDRIRENGNEDIVRQWNEDLFAMIDYTRQRDSLTMEDTSIKYTQDLGKEVIEELKDTQLLDEIENIEQMHEKSMTKKYNDLEAKE